MVEKVGRLVNQFGLVLTLYFVGKALFELGKFDESLEAYEEGLAVDKSNPTLRQGMGECRNAIEAKTKENAEAGKC